MKAPKDFNASDYINQIDSEYTLIEAYFMNPQLEIMDSIDQLYELLDIEKELMPLTTVDLLNKR